MQRGGRLRRAVLETLESRQLLSTYYVSPEGDDGNDGSKAHPWRTIQQAADSVVAGDVVEVFPGEYEGFSVGVNRPARGTADDPIVFRGRKIKDGRDGSYTLLQPIINQANDATADGIYVAPGSTHILFTGFAINDLAGEMRTAIRVNEADHVVLRGNWANGQGETAIAAIRSNGFLAAKNSIDGGWTTGIFVSGGAGPELRYNTVSDFRFSKGNMRFGIQLRADPLTSEPLRNADVHGNTIGGVSHRGVATRNSGVRGSRFRNNVLLSNRGDGMVFRASASAGASRNNIVVNNTINHYSADGWGVVLSENTQDTVLLNNIIVNRRGSAGSGGSLLVATGSFGGLEIDHNIYDERLSADGGATVIALDAWRDQVGQDVHSFTDPLDLLFRSTNTAFPFGRSRGIDAGTTRFAPSGDRWGNDRIGAPDIGALEAGYSDSLEDAPGHFFHGTFDGVVASMFHYAELAPAFYDGFEDRETTPEQPLGPAWEVTAWPGDDDGPDQLSLNPDLTLRGALLRSTAAVTGSVELSLYSGQFDGSVATGATRVFGIGNTFGSLSGNHWAAFVTRGGDDTFYAELNLGGTVHRVKLGNDRYLSGRFRVEPTETGFEFYEDSNLLATLDGTFPIDIDRRLLLGSHHASPEMYVDYAQAGPYVSGGTYISPVEDELLSGGWGRLIESAFAQLPGTSLSYETRTGQTATPDESWSAWEALGEENEIVSLEGRYIQFRVTFHTTDPDRTPLLFNFQYEIRPAAA